MRLGGAPDPVEASRLGAEGPEVRCSDNWASWSWPWSWCPGQLDWGRKQRGKGSPPRGTETHDAATETSRKERRWAYPPGPGVDSQLVTLWRWRRKEESKGSPSFRAMTERNPSEAEQKGKLQN